MLIYRFGKACWKITAKAYNWIPDKRDCVNSFFYFKAKFII